MDLQPIRETHAGRNSSNQPRSLRRLTTALAMLMVVQSALGLMYQEQYRDPEWIKAAWFGNDCFTLLVAVPLLIFAFIFANRGSIRGFLLWIGLLGYCVYNYAYYLLGVTLNGFFAIYVVLFVTSSVTLILALSHADVGVVASGFRRKAPLRLVGGYLIFVGVGLCVVWVTMWAAYAFAGQPTPVEPEAFKLVAALDLSLMVPILVAGGLLLWLKKKWGFIIAAIASIQGALYLLVLTLNSFVGIQRKLVESPGELPIWGPLAVLTGASAVLLLHNVRKVRK